MRKTGNIQRQCSEKSQRYILFLTGINNLIFADISLAGMPLRTLALLLTDFFCIAVYIYKREMELPRWKECGVSEKAMTVLLVASAVLLAASALTDSDNFWMYTDLVALLLIYPCTYGRKRFPQDIFCVYSASSFVTCILLLVYYLTGGLGKPLIALLLQKDAVVSWLTLGIMMNMIAYCFQERGQVWYGGNILLMAFLLAVQKNLYGMIAVGLIPLLIPVFCRPSKRLAKRAAQAGLMYLFLICNMSLITGYTPLPEGIVTYDLEVSVYMELFLAAMGIWFFDRWDKYTREAASDDTLSEMRVWYKNAVLAYLIGVAGMLMASKLFYADDASMWKGAAQVIINDLRESAGWESGVPGQLGQRFGVPGIVVGCVLIYLCIRQIYRTKHWRVKAHKLYRLITAVCLLQAVLLPQSMASLPVCVMFLFLFMHTGTQWKWLIQVKDADGREEQKGTCSETVQEKGEHADEADYSDSMLQRGGDLGDRTE
ncbi:MAG: hypothetical protein K1W30_14560 [Lachnospiraceae bacterium]